MTVQSDDRRLTIGFTGTALIVDSAGILTAQQVYDALLPLLPPPVPTAREVAEEACRFAVSSLADEDAAPRLYRIVGRWDQGGRP